MQTIIPIAGINKMNKKFLKSNNSWTFVIEFPPMTKAAQVD